MVTFRHQDRLGLDHYQFSRPHKFGLGLDLEATLISDKTVNWVDTNLYFYWSFDYCFSDGEKVSF